MKKVIVFSLSFVMVAALFGAGLKVYATTGDLVASIVLDIDCGTGVGIAFDGTNLWYSCLSDPDLRRADPTTGAVTATYDSVPGGLGAISYDVTRNAIWGAVAPNQVYRIDLDASKNVVGSTLVFTVPDSCGIIDGLAFDARNVADLTDDVFYYSDDCYTTTVDVYNLAGALVESFPVPPGFGTHNSGLAVGGQLLYLADLFANTTWVIDKTTKDVQFTYSNAVPSDPNFHSEDMECDTNTFASAGKHVMWSKEAYSPARVHAFEIPFGSCGGGGVPAEEICGDGIDNDGDGLVDEDCLLPPDVIPPEVACIESVNPHGQKIPPAGSTTLPGPKGGKNDDGFYQLLAKDNLPGLIQIFVQNISGSFSTGPLSFSSGDVVKITEAPGVIPSSKPMGSSNGQAGAVVAHITLDSDAVVVAIDGAGNVSTTTCFIPPLPK